MKKLRKLKIKLNIIKNILFNWDHFFIMNLDERNLKKMLREQDFDMDSSYHGLQYYNVLYIIKQIASTIDDDDLVLKKAEFQAKAHELRTKK